MSSYLPLQPCIPTHQKRSVQYKEWSPEGTSPVYCYWSLQTLEPLEDPFEYMVLPDACVDIVFDLDHKLLASGAMVMTPGSTAQSLILGTHFSYVGIRLKPGVWQESLSSIIGQTLWLDRVEGYDLRRIHQSLIAAEPCKRIAILDTLATHLEWSRAIRTTIFSETVGICQTVEAYTHALRLSRRQTQRVFRRRFGYRPHDFIKITRFQRSLLEGTFAAYTDQPHYIREFKRITNMTPREFYLKYHSFMSTLYNTRSDLPL